MGDRMEEEEGRVESVDDGYEPVGQPSGGNVPPPQEYSAVSYIGYSMLRYFSNPWAFLILLFVLYKLWVRLRETLLAPVLIRYEDWQEQRRVDAEAAAIKKNPDEYRERMESMERVRRHQQEKYAQKTEEWAQRKAEEEAARREQDIKDWEGHQEGRGYKNRAPGGVDSEREALIQQARLKNKKGFKPERNPLMDLGGSGGSYRPSRRGFSGGGGG